VTVEEAKKYIVKMLERIAGNKNVSKAYTDRMKKMNNKQFMQWLDDLIAEKELLAIIKPNGEDGYDIKKMYALADEMGLKLYEKAWITDENGIEHLTEHEPLITYGIVKALSQAQTSKMIVAKNDRSVDSLTGQPTRASTGNSLTGPEEALLASYGVAGATSELHSIRGGDEGAYAAYKTLLTKYGTASMAQVKQYSTGVKSTKVIQSLLLSAMLDANMV